MLGIRKMKEFHTRNAKDIRKRCCLLRLRKEEEECQTKNTKGKNDIVDCRSSLKSKDKEDY